MKKILSVLVVVALLITSYFLFFNTKDSISTVVSDFVLQANESPQSLERAMLDHYSQESVQRLNELKEASTPSARSTLVIFKTYENYLESNWETFTNKGTVTDVDIEILEESNGYQNIRYYITYSDGSTDQGRATLTKEEGNWKVYSLVSGDIL